MKPRSPYSDWAEVYVSETSRSRIPRALPTPKPPTENHESSMPDWQEKVVPEENHGMHIDGDRRYQER